MLIMGLEIVLTPQASKVPITAIIAYSAYPLVNIGKSVRNGIKVYLATSGR